MDVHAHTLSRKRQCELLGVARSSSYYKPVTPTAAEQEAEASLARALQALYLQDATLGRRRLPCMLERQHGIRAGYKRIATIRKKLGLRTIFRHPQTTVTANPRKEGKYPYRLRDKKIERIDEVWTSDITYLQIGQKNYYLCAVMDWASRGILGWSLKDNMSTDLCLEALEMAFSTGRRPQIFNTDQGSQYTSERWQTGMLEEGILISQDSKGRWADNIVMERFWRTYKHEFFLLEDIPSLQIAKERTARWLDYYNGQRAHSTLGNQSPQMYTEAAGMTLEPHFLRDFYAAERHLSLRSSPSQSSGSRSYAPNSLKKWLALHRPA